MASLGHDELRGLLPPWWKNVTIESSFGSEPGTKNTYNEWIIVFNTSKLIQNGCHFKDVIFKYIFWNENFWISLEISLKFVPKVPIDNIPALVQIKAQGAIQATSHYLNQWWLFYWWIYASISLNEFKVQWTANGNSEQQITFKALGW